ncbi:peroxiredoxin [Oceanobacillus halophilus]|uniref:Peroxiredoxin n=1 Tax=Oceanobacillus halophilus TaxID=930130 RepID=A0A495A4S2_9BACI|nr:peroxiredoxin [Oceanobacillus halophilus]RKQ34648.1 peroxiredoxin [Oceanobacillus halophilus]
MNERSLSIGDQFPEMTVQTTHGTKTLPDDYEGRWLILFSHPGDFTPVCTTEFVAFQQLYPEFQKRGTELMGLSIDQVQAHMKWTEWIEQNLGVPITFPIIADPLGTVANKLGMVHKARQTSTVRGVYFIDDKGMIRAIFFYPAEVGRGLKEILRTLYALQTSDHYHLALPADWPNNNIIGDRAIVPPAANEQQKAERLKQAETGEVDCFDWWFCYKNLRKE